MIAVEFLNTALSVKVQGEVIMDVAILGPQVAAYPAYKGPPGALNQRASCNNTNSNIPEAQFLLGIEHLIHDGWDNVDDFYTLFTKAAEQGHALAKCYQTLIEMKRCAEQYFSEGTPLGNWVTFNQYELGCIVEDLSDSAKEVGQCGANIVSLLDRCVQAKYIHAWVEYYKSSSVILNPYWTLTFKRNIENCANLNYAPAKYWLAQLLKSSDPRKSQGLLKEAAEQNYAPAQYELSKQLEDKVEAAQWFHQAVEQGYPPAVQDMTNYKFSLYVLDTRLRNGPNANARPLPKLPKEIIQKIWSHTALDPTPLPQNGKWLDVMLETILWDKSVVSNAPDC